MKCTAAKNFVFIAILFLSLSLGFAQQTYPNYFCDGVIEGDFARDAASCSTWIRCRGGQVTATGLCPEGSFFNVDRQKCTTESGADCFTCPDNGSLMSFTKVKNSCKRYTRCIRGVITEHICDGDLQFNEATGMCDLESVVQCQLPIRCSVNIAVDSYYVYRPDPENCSKAVLCYYGELPHVQECEGGRHVDVTSLECTVPNGTCPSSSTTTTYRQLT